MLTFQARRFVVIIAYLGFFKGLVTLISCFVLIVDFLGNIAFKLYQLSMLNFLKFSYARFELVAGLGYAID